MRAEWETLASAHNIIQGLPNRMGVGYTARHWDKVEVFQGLLPRRLVIQLNEDIRDDVIEYNGAQIRENPQLNYRFFVRTKHGHEGRFSDLEAAKQWVDFVEKTKTRRVMFQDEHRSI